jgi:mono/diheme cytochrome c family protein
MKKTILCLLSAFVVIIMTEAFQTSQQPWAVPEKNAKMANPVKADAKSIAAGKALFTKNCVDCHGKKGLGDGAKVPELKSTPADMTSQAFQSQTDGSLFYKIAEGRKDMPKFKKDLPEDEDRWNLVNYVRSFGAKK